MTPRAWKTAVIVVAMGMPLAGCPCRKEPPAPPPAPPPIHRLCIQAGPDLNFYRGKSHTLRIRLFQLSSADAFEALDLPQLLDPRTPVAGQKGTVTELTVYPDTSAVQDIDLEAGAKQLGVVAGYYHVEGKAKATRPLLRNLPPEKAGDANDADDDEDKDGKTKHAAGGKAGGSPCLKLGANGIEGF